jgi:FHA domain
LSVAHNGQNLTVDKRLNGQTIISELIRNMAAGQFEMAYSILLPCVFSVYLHPEDHTRLAGVFDLLAEDAKRALCAEVDRLNTVRSPFGRKRGRKPPREYKIAGNDWTIEFLPDTEHTVPLGDIEIHSELNETPTPGYQGAKTTLMNREPSVTSTRGTGPRGDTRTDTRKTPDRVYAEIRYEDDSGPQLYLITQNQVRVGRGGADEPMDLALYANDEVSREHIVIRRDPATGRFYIADKSTNGTWLDGRRMKRDVEQELPEQADIGVAEVITLAFQVRK